ncbi:hypothetical protein N657DRAFT_651823 [Parathielavia appendiculata]|uniref:FAD-binding PCMH-type domain-containing protein n=1 Tax=Parathielavia appendiculata TaxID=2587402 RepID=A0AAN6U861_9PEZI|nr:hypothetical protein N657DRAFT_651823 [Parathielavia appendiculata]
MAGEFHLIILGAILSFSIRLCRLRAQRTHPLFEHETKSLTDATLHKLLQETDKCTVVRSSYPDPYFHENDSTSIFWSQYQGKTCMPTEDPTSGNCTCGGYPVYAVMSGMLADPAGFIKNTGNCYLGKSSGAGALRIWTYNLKHLKHSAGVTIRETVGYIGGYVAGGEHTTLSGLYDMTAEHVMVLEVVTADGRFVTASPKSNPDLYWAMRGGGGRTVAVVTFITIRVYPELPVVTSTLIISTSATVTADASSRPYAHLHRPNSYTFTMHSVFAPNYTLSSFHALTKPFFERLKELNNLLPPDATLHLAFYPAYNATWGSDRLFSSTGRVSVPSNQLLQRANWADPAKFNATFVVIRTYVETSRLLMGYHQAPCNRAHADNAVNSAWREAGADADNPTAADLKAASEDLRRNMIARSRERAPESEGGGAYLNEANTDEPEWQSTFYGMQYKREVFYATTAVGREGWGVRDGEQGVQRQNGRLCRV